MCQLAVFFKREIGMERACGEVTLQRLLPLNWALPLDVLACFVVNEKKPEEMCQVNI